MRELTHYGKKVTYQIVETPFRKFLRQNGIEYFDLPILDADVIQYYKEEEIRYALTRKMGEDEAVYITDSIPLDMDWGALLRDCRGQLDGAAPEEMATKAKRIIDKATAAAWPDTPDLFAPSPEPTIQDVAIEIVRLGYDLNELQVMDHHDIDPEYWDQLMKEK